MAESFHQLYDEARRVTGAWTYPALAALTGASLRSMQRHHGLPSSEHMARFILATHAKNPDLARRLAVAAGHSVEALGIAAPPPTPAAPAVAPADRLRQNADSVLLAAAHAVNLPPEAVRPAVAAALDRAHELGASPADLAAQLAKPLPGPRKKG